ncbi:hypothetical protein Tco_1367937, partial [Tanacetum coccineum]
MLARVLEQVTWPHRETTITDRCRLRVDMSSHVGIHTSLHKDGMPNVLDMSSDVRDHLLLSVETHASLYRDHLPGACVWSRKPKFTITLNTEVDELNSLKHRSTLEKAVECFNLFIFPQNSNSCTLHQVRVVATQEELGAKDKSSYDMYLHNNIPTNSLPHVIRNGYLRKGRKTKPKRQPHVRQTSVESSNLEKPDNPPI